MANFDDIFNSQPKEETVGQSFASFDKDEWAAQKKQERENAFALIDETAQHMTNDGELFQSYLDVLKALIHNAPCPIEISQQMPEGINAAYRPQDKKIFVRAGLDAGDIFRGLSQELAHAHLDNGEYKRNEHAFTAYCASYIHGLGSQLKPTGLLVITDTMLNRVTLNWKKGKRTHVFIDEFHVVFENEFSAQFFNSAWRQFRKRNAYPTAITQNVEYLLDSVQASTMLSNSEFVIMLNQAASDREKLAQLLNISNEQMSYITNADAGCGLIKYGSALVPFINQFPRDTKLYQLMTTRPGEGEFARGQD